MAAQGAAPGAVTPGHGGIVGMGARADAGADATIARALALAEEHGLPVFPCHAGKAPYTEHGLHDASRSAETITAWWSRWPDALVGVPTGPASGIVVVDIDPAGAGWYREHADRLGCGRVHTTRRGHHLLYRLPAGATIRNSASRLAPGVDVRGAGGSSSGGRRTGAMRWATSPTSPSRRHGSSSC